MSGRHWRSMLAIVLAISLFAVACGGSDDDVVESADTTEPAEADEPAEPAEPQTNRSGGQLSGHGPITAHDLTGIWLQICDFGIWLGRLAQALK